MPGKHKIRAIQLRAYKPIGDRELPEWVKDVEIFADGSGTVMINQRRSGVILRCGEGDWLTASEFSYGTINDATFREFFEAME